MSLVEYLGAQSDITPSNANNNPDKCCNKGVETSSFSILNVDAMYFSSRNMRRYSAATIALLPSLLNKFLFANFKIQGAPSTFVLKFSSWPGILIAFSSGIDEPGYLKLSTIAGCCR